MDGALIFTNPTKSALALPVILKSLTENVSLQWDQRIPLASVVSLCNCSSTSIMALNLVLLPACQAFLVETTTSGGKINDYNRGLLSCLFFTELSIMKLAIN